MEEAGHAALVANLVTETASATAKAVAEAASAAAKVLAADQGLIVTAIALLRQEVAMIKDQLGDNSQKMDKVTTKLNEVAEGRPSWAVTLILGLLSSLVVGMAVFVAARM